MRKSTTREKTNWPPKSKIVSTRLQASQVDQICMKWVLKNLQSKTSSSTSTISKRFQNTFCLLWTNHSSVVWSRRAAWLNVFLLEKLNILVCVFEKKLIFSCRFLTLWLIFVLLLALYFNLDSHFKCLKSFTVDLFNFGNLGHSFSSRDTLST